MLPQSIKKTILLMSLTIGLFLFSTLWAKYLKNSSQTRIQFFRDNNIITSFQSGFIPGDSTVNQLTDIYNTFCKALDEGKEVRAIFCDISKAFDRVWHKGLLFKLNSVGNLWFSSFVVHRLFRF